MKKSLVLLASMAVANAMPANAAHVSLFEWGVNIDGGIDFCAFGDICDPTALPISVDTSLFDFNSGLGTISYTITGEGAHYTSLYLDHEVGTFDDEFGTNSDPVTTLAAGQSWEIDDPFAPVPEVDTIFHHFTNGTLDNSNAVPGAPNDVAMALAWDFVLGAGIGAGETATVDFMVSQVAPIGDFFIVSLTDPGTQPVEEVYFSSTLTILANPVPVPGALLLFGSGLVGLVGMSYRRKSQKTEV